MTAITLDQWHRVSRLLDELFEADAPTRAIRLAEIGGTEPLIAQHVQRLLAHKEGIDTSQFLEGSALSWSDEHAAAGRVVGSYTLELLLGTGGMGSVWMARRSDGRYDARVALKFLNLGLLGKAGEERFRREGVALARLSHPNIAQLIDAGTDRGQPYLVLEYVEGWPIDRWCDDHSLGIEARLELFREALGAVAHAHGRLILHRDLKPSNILVTAEGRPKLLDFGVAKLLDQPTEATARAFTPDFAAPEQIRAGDITTASDVYGLGVLLYLLLVGEHPTAQSADAVERMLAVVEHEPTPVSEVALRMTVTSAAERRSTPKRLSRFLRGDLDNILAKALKKDPAERYATAASLADDLRRFLRHEPVEAQPDSVTYRLGKFVRRNRSGVFVATTGALLVLGGIGAVLWQSVEVRRQRDEAFLQAERAVVGGNVFHLILDEIASSDHPLTQRGVLELTEQLITQQYSDNPRVTVLGLLTVVGRYYNLGELDRGHAVMQRVRTVATASGDPLLIAAAECNSVLMPIARGDVAAAARHLAVGLEALQRVPNPLFEQVVECIRAEVDVLYAQGDLDGALERTLWGVRYSESSGKQDSQLYPPWFSYLARFYRDRCELEPAMSAARRLQRLFEERGRTSSLDYQIARYAEARVLMLAGQYRDAHALMERIVTEWGHGADGLPLLFVMTRGELQFLLGDAEGARTVLLDVVDRAQQHGNRDVELSAELLLSRVLLALNEPDEAERHLAIVENAPNDNVWRRFEHVTPAVVHGAAQLLRKQPDVAIRTLDAEIARMAAAGSRPTAARGAALRMAARGYLAAGETPAALKMAREAVAMAMRVSLDASRNGEVGVALLLLARAQAQAGYADEARSTAGKAVGHLTYGLGADHPRTREARALL